MRFIARECRSVCRAGRVLSWLIATLWLLTVSGCGKPFNVKPRTELPKANYTATASTSRIAVKADPILDEDLLYETFDANLILAGILPVRVSLLNSGEESLDLKKARFEIRTPDGRSFKASSPRDAFKRTLSYYEISTYNKAGYKESQSDFVGYGLDTSEPLAPQQSRDGILFFLIPPELARGAGLTLQISRLDRKAPPIELKLS